MPVSKAVRKKFLEESGAVYDDSGALMPIEPHIERRNKDGAVFYELLDEFTNMTEEEALAVLNPALKQGAVANKDWIHPRFVARHGLALPVLHEKQREIVAAYMAGKNCIVMAGRRAGKTRALAALAVGLMVQGYHVIYATPRAEQATSFWNYAESILANARVAAKGIQKITAFGARPIKDKDAKSPYRPVLIQRNRMYMAVSPNTDNLGSLMAYSVFEPDVIRGLKADALILDEAQMMKGRALFTVGMPMLADRNGHAIVSFTRPDPNENVHGLSASDRMFALRLYNRVRAYYDGNLSEYMDGGDDYARIDDPETFGGHETFDDWVPITFTSMQNPHLTRAGLSALARNMPADRYAREILCQEPENDSLALWTPGLLDACRVSSFDVSGMRVVISIDPAVKGGETGIVVVASNNANPPTYYVLEDATTMAGAGDWPALVYNIYNHYSKLKANVTVVYEENQGGLMVETILRQYAQLNRARMKIDRQRALVSKSTRAKPVVHLYAMGYVKHVGQLKALEEEMTMWIPTSKNSPNRIDALVWGITYLQTMKNKPVITRLGR